jgi:hypothetical protein
MVDPHGNAMDSETCFDMASGRSVNWQDEFLDTSARLADLRQ